MNYFAETGLTSTRAQQLCALAQSRSTLDRERMEKMKFCDTDMFLFIANVSHNVEKGYDGPMEELTAIAERIARANAFEAYVKEAIKAKEKLFEEVNSYSIRDWARKYRPELEKEAWREYFEIYNGSVCFKEVTVEDWLQRLPERFKDLANEA